ncbi:glycosyltransferase family 2 protein [Kineococcus sp. SYSU DK005]|uniref:glycosyltransferase family 2 protein n=1 Tax=Kineococcus sp. SYSU DK005 TaxID=3383126 RepID=UPI003D7EF030
MKRLSVVIANYNYAAYVGQAIDSALALSWDDVEVVVVDDGSTDVSRDVISGYGSRVRALFTENGGQRVAVNRGFAESTGDVVVFLDADDVLPPDLPVHLARAWRDGVSKVQFRMQRIDRIGVAIGTPFPAYDPVPSPADVRRWATTTTAYPTPPASGNAYARDFLERIFPLGPELGDFADSGCLAAAPFLGDVVTVPEVVVGYRQHGANDSNLLVDDTRFTREVVRARARWRFARDVAGAGGEGHVDEAPLRRSRELLQFRVAAERVSPAAAGLPGDGRPRQLLDVLRSPLQPGPESWRDRVVIAGWCASVLLAPRPAVRRLLELRWGRRQPVQADAQV